MRGLASALVVALTAPAAAAGPAAGPNDRPARIGLFVGSNAAATGRERLRHAETDALRMRQVFVDLGAMRDTDAVLLLGPSADELSAALDDVIARATARPDATLIFYYSGHADDRALLLGATELPLRDLERALDDADTRMSVRLVDACRSGALTRRKGPRLGAPFAVQVRPASEGRVTITSTAAWEDALESDRLGGSFFTIHLASGLRGAADADDDGAVSLGEAYAYVYARTVESTRATAAGPQHPTFRYDLRGRGDTVLTWLSPDGIRTAALELEGDADYLVVDAAAGRVVAEVLTRPAGQTLVLRPGRYRLARRTRDALWEGTVDLRPGDRVQAGTQLSSRLEYAQLVRKGGARARTRAHAIWLESGARSGPGRRLAAAPMIRIVYALALRWLTIRPRIGFATNRKDSALDTPRLVLDVTEWTAGVDVRRAWDVGPLTLGAGAVVDALWLRQTERDGQIAPRDATGFVLGGAAGVQTAPWHGLATALNAELTAYSFPATDATRGPTGSGALHTALTLRLTLGIGYAF